MLPDRSEDEYNFMRVVLRGQLRCLPRGYIFPTSAMETSYCRCVFSIFSLAFKIFYRK
jgi:hypothetical protein